MGSTHMSDDVHIKLDELTTKQTVLKKSLNRTKDEIVILRDVISRVEECFQEVDEKLNVIAEEFPDVPSNGEDDRDPEEVKIEKPRALSVSNIPRIVIQTPYHQTSPPPQDYRRRSRSPSPSPVRSNRYVESRAVEYRLLDLEARSRRNNLVFYGIPEPPRESLDDCELTLRRFFASKVGVPDPFRIELSRVRRIGKKNLAESSEKCRPIIATFKNEQIKSGILNHGFMLKNTHYGIAQDYPEAIRKARRELLPEYKQARARGRKAVIKYPAKLVVDGRVVMDLYPGWKFQDEI